jgi:hypothetical protein
MKKIKICAIMSFSLFGITIGSSAVIINSCTTNDQKYFEFINQRTFNIQTITTDHTGHQVGGTLTI